MRIRSPRDLRGLTIVLGCCALVAMFGPPIFATSASAPSAEPSTSPAASDLFDLSNLTAWCIVPYDGKHRGPAERAEMLERLGLKHFAYDWRGPHLPGFPTELDELAKHHIALEGIWFPDQLNANARFMLATLAAHHVQTQLWVASWGY